MKILVAEYADHWKVLENTHKLIKKNSKKSEVTFFINQYRAQKHLIPLLFKDAEKANWKIHKYHSSTYFMHLLLIAYKYDIVNISTGPEDPHFTNLFNTVFLFLCSVVYKNKIVLTVKNTRPYLRSSRGVKSFFLHLSVSNIKVITFESESLKNVFHNETKIPKTRLCASYDRYVDFSNLQIPNQMRTLEANGKYRIGLLGAVQESRRDYRDIIVALQRVSSDIRNKIEFVTLGNSNGGTSNSVLSELMKLVDVDTTDGWISVDDFDLRGASCHLLISPLKPEMEYGTYKGSGTFGDAIYLKKKVIIPNHVDPFHEFEEIALLYKDAGALSMVFSNLDDLINEEIKDEFYDKFTSKSVFDNIAHTMKVNGMLG